MITPSDNPDWLPGLIHLSQQGVACSVILLDRASFEDGADSPRESSRGMQDAIRRLGSSCYIIRQGEIGIPSEETERQGFWEFKVTGTGKVITTRSPLKR
jgi:hypothetical protein